MTRTLTPSIRFIDLERSSNRIGLERGAIAIGLLIFFTTGYFGVGLSTDPASARRLTSPFDSQIPFMAHSVWVYLWTFPAALSPLFFVRCPRLFRRTALAYGAVIAASLVCFMTLPVTSVGLRIDPAALSTEQPSQWAVALLYSLDPPHNLFPSLHLSIATLAAFSAWKAAKTYGAVAFLGVGFVSVSVCTVKQHYLVDVLAGVALAALAYALILHPYRQLDGTSPAYSWRGPTSYLALLLVIYAGFFVAYFWST